MRKNEIQTMYGQRHVRKEIEKHELQELEEDPFIIEREPDPRKEQEEYFSFFLLKVISNIPLL